MTPFTHRSRLRKLTRRVGHSSRGVGAVADQLSVRPRTAAKAGLIAGGVAGVTAASAGISALRRRGAEDDS